MSELQASTLEQLLALRHSCRAFLPRCVPRAVQQQLLALAQRTASWCNSQPWQVHITEGAATERFREQMLAPAAQEESGPDFDWPARYQGVYSQRGRECGLALYEGVGIVRGDREASARQARENFRLFGAPHVAVVTTEAELGTYGAVDCGGYVANFLLAAASLGVATVPQAALARHPQRIRDFFGLPASRRVVCGISFGYADAAHPANAFRTGRAELPDTVAWISD